MKHLRGTVLHFWTYSFVRMSIIERRATPFHTCQERMLSFRDIRPNSCKYLGIWRCAWPRPKVRSEQEARALRCTSSVQLLFQSNTLTGASSAHTVSAQALSHCLVFSTQAPWPGPALPSAHSSTRPSPAVYNCRDVSRRLETGRSFRSPGGGDVQSLAEAAPRGRSTSLSHTANTVVRMLGEQNKPPGVRTNRILFQFPSDCVLSFGSVVCRRLYLRCRTLPVGCARLL